MQSAETLPASNSDAPASDVQDIVKESLIEQTELTETLSDAPSLIDKNDLQPPDLRDIHVSKKTHLYCSREEYPSLYEDVKVLLTRRQEVLNSVLGVDYDRQLNMDEFITDEDDRVFYLFQEDQEEYSLADVRAALATVYTDDYINTDGAWYLTHLFCEEQGKLYRTGGDGWADGLYDDWVLWQTDDPENYCIIGYTAIGAWDYGECPILSIWTITRTDEGFRIADEETISFLQNIYVLPEADSEAE